MPIDVDERLERLRSAERRALALLDRIEALGLIAPGRTETAIEEDIRDLASQEFGVVDYWHDRIVRAGSNTLCNAGDQPPVRTVAGDDIVFLDLGPVFARWEADVGRSFVVGADSARTALVDELPRQFERLRRRFISDPSSTGAALYDFAVRSAEEAGWRFGGRIAGHIVGEFNHRDWPGDRHHARIGPGNPTPMSDPDVFGRPRFWIGEIHLVSPDGAFGGFYERLLDV